MLHTKFRGNRPAGSGEEDFEGFLRWDLSPNAVSIWTGFPYCCGDKSSLQDAFSISRL